LLKKNKNSNISGPGWRAHLANWRRNPALPRKRGGGESTSGKEGQRDSWESQTSEEGYLSAKKSTEESRVAFLVM